MLVQLSMVVILWHHNEETRGNSEHKPRPNLERLLPTRRELRCYSACMVALLPQPRDFNRSQVYGAELMADE